MVGIRAVQIDTDTGQISAKNEPFAIFAVLLWSKSIYDTLRVVAIIVAVT
jgi:hypothetical protein